MKTGYSNNFSSSSCTSNSIKPKRFYQRILVCLMLLTTIFLAACSAKKASIESFHGSTMGTSFHVSIETADKVMTAAEREKIDSSIKAQLENIEALMSSYRQQSELMQFNRAPAKQWFDIDQHTYNVLNISKQVYEQSQKVLDISVSPLIDLWGFAAKKQEDKPPSEKQIKEALTKVGLDKLDIRAIDTYKPDAGLEHSQHWQAKKTQAALQLNVSAVAKGYAVDVVAQTLKDQGYANFLVEVGGEVYVAGSKANNKPWRLGLETPDAAPGTVQAAIKISDVAVATSGDYRNYYTYEGKRYSHSIDPRTGYPVTHNLASVTIIAKSSGLADAWATAIEVLGFDEGFKVAQKHGLAAYFILREGEQFVVRYTPEFNDYLEK